MRHDGSSSPQLVPARSCIPLTARGGLQIARRSAIEQEGELDGTEGSTSGVGLGHDLGAGVQAFAGYRLMQEDGAQDESVLPAGVRVKFN